MDCSLGNPSQIELSSIHPEQKLASPVDDLEEHMSAFDVKEFVQEYEREILRRLNAADQGMPRGDGDLDSARA